MVHGRTWKDKDGLWTGEVVHNNPPSKLVIINFPGMSSNFEDVKNFLFGEVGVSEIFVMENQYSLVGKIIKPT